MFRDVYRYANAMFVFFVLVAIALLGFGGYRAVTTFNEAKEYRNRMYMCNEEDCTFHVDGVEFSELSTDFIAGSYGKYNVVVDDAGKQVVLTTIAEQKTTRPKFIPLIIRR